MDDFELFGLTAFVVLGLGAQWVAWRLRLPPVVVALTAGLLAGPGLRQAGASLPRLAAAAIDPEDLFGTLLPPLVSLAVAVLLFQNALALDLRGLRGGLTTRFVGIGNALAFVLASAAAHFALGFEWPLSAVLASIVLIAGPAEIAPGDPQVRALDPAAKLLDVEGRALAALGPLVVIACFLLVETPGGSEAAADALACLGSALVIGGGLGLVCALLLVALLRLAQVPDFLQWPTALLLALYLYATCDLMQYGAGIFAVVVLGITLASQRWADVRPMLQSAAPLRLLLVPVLLVACASRLHQDVLTCIAWSDQALFVAILIVLVRPLTAIPLGADRDIPARARMLLTWVSPRGATAVALVTLLALRIEESGDFARADTLQSATLVTVLVTATLHALTAGPLSRWARRGVG